MIARRLQAMILALLLLAPGTGIRFADNLGEKKKVLEDLQRELSQHKKKDEENKKKEKSILNEFETIDKRWTTGKKELHQIEKSIREKDREIERLDGSLEELKIRSAAKRGILNARLRRIYKEGQVGDLMILTGFTGYQDFLGRVHAMVEISQRDMAAFKEYQSAINEIREKENSLEGRRREMVDLKKSAAGKMEGLQSEKMNKTLLLAKVRTEEELTRQAISELEESTLKVQELMRKLERHPEKRTGAGFGSEKGRLPWPNPGSVVGRFGRNKHPRYDFYVFKKGMEIRPEGEDYFHAVYDGTVVYADWFKGYGLMVIVDHGENFYSLYAHASKLMVGVGDKVRQNMVLGEVGETGYSQDKNLYFEIRQGDKAVDPSLWLSRKK
ncbi:MAG TPA: peptidoglycan DD-metalloendopeptidase family protein [Nitrospiria bacterium]|nr:peptidoglycan DD-metalloendopeptidase family protein [Nitrospiria bacterium]